MKPDAARSRRRKSRNRLAWLAAAILASAEALAQEEGIDPGRIATGIRVLREGLEEGPEAVRDCAWKALSRIDRPEARTLLEQSLQHPQREVRIAAARALRLRGDPAVLPILERELKSQVWSVREEALRDLARVQGPAAAPSLREILRSPRQPAAVRAAAADGLGILREASAVSDLAAQLGSPSDLLRRHALLALGEIGSPEAIPGLRDHLKGDRDPLETVLTVRALALAGDPEGILRAETLLISADPHHRRLARETLRQRGIGLARPAYRRALSRSGAPIPARIELVVELADAEDRGALPDLRALLSEPDPYLREAAAAALARLGDRSAYAILEASLRESRWRVADPVHRLLGGAEDPGVVTLLNEPFRNGEDADRFWAAGILARFQVQAAVEFLERTARRSDSPLRLAAADTLAATGNWAALPTLVDSLDGACDAGMERRLDLLAGAPPSESGPLFDQRLQVGPLAGRVNAAAVLLRVPHPPSLSERQP